MAGALKVIGPQACTATDAGDILAGSTTVMRRLRYVQFANTAGTAAQVNLGLPTTAGSYAAATSLLDNVNVPADDVLQKFYTPGIPFLNKAIRAFATATTVTVTLVYEED